VGLVTEALAHHGLNVELTVYRDGGQMIEWLDRVEAGDLPCPDIVLLDLNLPRYDGRAILARLRRGTVCASLPVVIITSSNAPSDRESATRLGANAYFRKPIDYDEFMQLGGIVRQIVKR
jgi:two-component system, chemotaxis family, response regulator Rcp1